MRLLADPAAHARDNESNGYLDEPSLGDWHHDRGQFECPYERFSSLALLQSQHDLRRPVPKRQIRLPARVEERALLSSLRKRLAAIEGDLDAVGEIG